MKQKDLQKKTVNSFRRINDYIYTLDYSNDYRLDKMLSGNVAGLTGMLRTIVREMHRQKRAKNECACSAFNAVTPTGDGIVGRNFDYMDAPLIALWTHPENGYKSVAVDTATFMLYGKKSIAKALDSGSKKRLLMAPYCSMEGINEKGLVIAVLEIKTAATHQRTGKPAVTTTTAIRGILDTCATVSEAISFLEKYDMNDLVYCNYHYIISDATGASAIAEYVGNKLKVINSTSENPWLSLTNFFVSGGGDNSKGFGYERKNYISGIQNSHNGVLTEEEAMNVLDNVHLYYYHKRGYAVITLWSCVYNTAKKTMTLCAGLDYKNAYVFSPTSQEVKHITLSDADTLEPFDFPHIDKEMVALKHKPIPVEKKA